MKTALKCASLVLIVVALATSSAFSADPKYSGFLGDPVVYSQLTPGPEGGAKMRWLKPGVDFSKYNKLMIDSVIFYFGEDSNKGIDPKEMNELADACNLELVNALKDKYPIVGEPGPGVARIRFAITNFKASKPGISAISSVMPIGIGISLLKKGATGGWSGGGQVGVEVMVLDTATNDVIAMGVDEKNAAFEDRFSRAGVAKEAFKFWAERIAKFLDEAKAKPTK
jgi:hypothetical protein